MIISILFEISASALFLEHSKNLANFSLDIVIKYIFKKECISRQLVCFIFMRTCLSYWNSIMSDIVYKKYKILVHTITFSITSAEIKESGGQL